MVKTIEQTLSGLIHLIGAMEQQLYVEPCRMLQHASIGQHVRHIIEVFECLRHGYESGQVHYDKRARDPALENQPSLALERLDHLCRGLDLPDRKLQYVAVFEQQNKIIETTYHRELIYNLEHCIHHQALIRVAIENMSDVVLPAEFGVAPATMAYRKGQK
ncbi:MAG: DinB family protein [Saprospiraceae bacterium]|nr:DinB family protein [Saprospiraceae bacterium]